MTDFRRFNTHHVTERREFDFAGDHLYEVTATADDGQTDHGVIAADREGQATSRLMILTDMRLRGQHVDYDIALLDAEAVTA